MTATGGDGMAPWHVDGGLAGRYAADALPETDAWSVEKHVEACGQCAAEVSAAVRARRETAAVLAAVREGVLAAVTAEAGAPDGAGPVRRSAPRPRSGAGPVRRLLRAVRGPGPRTHHDAGRGRPPVGVPGARGGRLLWAAGPALRGPWLLALVLVAVGALALAYGAGLGGAARPLLLVVAPVLPLAGVVVSYGRHTDPMHEIAAATPSGGLRLLLTRTAVVLGVSIPALTLAGAALPPSAAGPGPAAWLLPGLAMTLAALALGSYVGCRTGASSVAAAWAVAVVLSAGVSPSAVEAPVTGAARYFAGPSAQGAWAAAALLCAALLAARRRSFDHLETS
ncbi:zf-HC2 domain-containing protein [Streptomyces sp. NPDC057496]|uniref:zf-HC2 domain-containing protein n=1 Tax=Streptomyces sp. NPDC057496 TaxID=3346149 RepID=UPI0036B76A9C